MKYRKIQPTKKRKRRLPKLPPFNGEAKTAVALAFAGLDGVEGLVKWAKLNSHNRGMFYALFGKLIPLTMNAPSVQVGNTNINVHIESDKSRAALEQAFARILASRGTGDKAGVVIDARANRESVPQIEAQQTEAEPLPSPAAEQTAAQAEQHQPDDVVKLKPFHPGAPPRELSSTEKYIEWIANKRDQWSNNT